ncbi:MAG: UDP-N-acetylglucosamine 2-epimerase (non-hydrolyzing) [Deltaproteobacteria bacterium]|nr:UDP-N-acetylglucosamine 2-epimerase (non-hydrolyzing) [Deltaproteobacteria bacterium]
MQPHSKLKIALVFGTRPEIIKLSSLMRLFELRHIPYFMIHTGQHYSPRLDSIFFKELGLPKPQYLLRIRSKGPQLQGDHTGRMLIAIEKILLEERPTHVLVQGDTNTVLAGSLASSKISTTSAYTGMRFQLGHVEAGLRSYDRSMPEEINRVLSDHLSDLLFAPTGQAKKILLGEGIEEKKIFVTGNTIVDAVYQNLELAKHIVRRVTRETMKDYVLLTLHRQENVEEPKRLREILRGIEKTAEILQKIVLFPIHPRTEKRLESFGIPLPACIRKMEPVGYLEFLMLESAASLIMTDSGGVQEEACILKVPCVTLRTTTERPETVAAGANQLGGVESGQIVQAAQEMSRRERIWENPYGDGRAALNILQHLDGGE